VVSKHSYFLQLGILLISVSVLLLMWYSFFVTLYIDGTVEFTMGHSQW
jgi:uncharacterized membrane protein YukC